MPDEPKILIGFVLFDGFTGLDLIGPHEVLARLDSRCVLVANNLEPVSSSHGLRVLPDLTFSTCAQLDVLVVPGGPGQEQAMYNEELISFVARQSAKSRWTASVCTGALLLARAGLLMQRHATTHWLAMDELHRLGAIATNKRVVWEDPVVTAAGVSAGIDMALQLASTLAGQQAAQRIQLAIEYDPEPPFDAGSPDNAPKEVVDHLRSTSRFARDKKCNGESRLEHESR
jgi:transcriptional regulator GlxA family with amidase domain